MPRKMGVKGKEFVKNNFNWDKISNDFLKSLKETQYRRHLI